MRCLTILLAVTVAAFVVTAPNRSSKLFDGKTFNGWEGNLKVFRIEKGSIVCGDRMSGIPRNEFLCTTKEYADFELGLKFKLIGEGANGGVQVRSKRIPNDTEVSGYQADMGDGYWGSLYDESRRNRTLVKPDEGALKKALRHDDWNGYRILCEGKRIRLWINGIQMVDYLETEEGIPQTGVIGLQIHGGKPSEAWYRDIVIREITAR